MESARVATDRAKCLAAIAFLGAVVMVGATVTRAWESAMGVARPTDSQKGFDGPISFEPNQGQADRNVKFVARGPGYVLYVTERGTLLSLHRETGDLEKLVAGAVAINVADATGRARLVALDPLSSRSSYFSGPDRTKWITGIPNFAQVQFHNAYPGIDVICHGTHGSLAYEFKVEAGAEPSLIAMEFQGARNVQLTRGGELSIGTTRGELRLKRPFAYQEIGEKKHAVPVCYVVKRRRVRFGLGNYERSKALIIDPVLSYVKFLR